jgi:hypothetical protein
MSKILSDKASDPIQDVDSTVSAPQAPPGEVAPAQRPSSTRRLGVVVGAGFAVAAAAAIVLSGGLPTRAPTSPGIEATRATALAALSTRTGGWDFVSSLNPPLIRRVHEEQGDVGLPGVVSSPSPTPSRRVHDERGGAGS